ncbi:MAG: LacI family DNA-binding transcriptional regulator [Kiritimatiellae bacterium]|nr:LacI family DNA-binding transcriptional regulator [Kiritimatiellia bacterium]
MRITQKEMARRLGISASLVSRALSGTADRIGADPNTVRRIHQTARALGYVPSAAARQLRGAGQAVIGLAVADLQDPFFGPAVAEIITQFHRAGYALALTGFERRKADPADVELLLQHDLRALLLLGEGSLAWTRRFKERKIPMVRLGRGPRAPGMEEIRHDETLGMTRVADHLIRLGHRRFALAGARQPVHENRLEQARKILVEHGIRRADCLTALGSGAVLTAGAEAADMISKRLGTNWPTAVICSSDAIAMGIIRGAGERGIPVPGRVSVTGYDDLALAELATPPLTSVRQPFSAMVAAALRRVQTGRPAAPAETFAPELMIRGSTDVAHPTLERI